MRTWLAEAERRKLSSAMFAAAVLLVGGVLLAGANERAYRANRLRETSVQADILSASVTAALAFDDRKAAQAYIDALRVNPLLEAAAIYDQRGRVFAGFTRGGDLPVVVQPGGRWTGGALSITRRVSEGGAELGTVYVSTAPERLGALLTRHGGTALLVIMASFLLGQLGRAYHALDRRAGELARVNAELRREALERERAEEALLQAKKMEALGQLTGGIAHDFNNLLQAMQGSFELIRRAPGDEQRVMRLADIGHQASERGNKLTSQLLAFSRASQLQLRPVVVAEVIEGMSTLLTSTAGPLIKLRLDLHPDRPPVLVDSTQLEMAVLNVAVNARDVMREGGTLTISVRPTRVEKDPELRDGLYVEVSVSDTGPGMPPSVQARAFEPFFTTKSVGQGTGLGLAQVYAMARQSGGVARIRSEPGQGTTVSFFLRATEERSSASEPLATSFDTTPQAAAVPMTVMAVDDDDDVRTLLRELLEALGHQVVEAADGRAALAQLSEWRPDLMLVDFAMPGVNGAEVAAAARRIWPGLPIVFASGYADLEQVEGAVGADAPVLRKPFSLDELKAVLASALRTAGAATPAE